MSFEYRPSRCLPPPIQRGISVYRYPAKREVIFSDRRRPLIAAWDESSEAPQQTDRRCMPKDFRAAGRDRLSQRELRRRWQALRPYYMQCTKNREPWPLVPPRARPPGQYFPRHAKYAAACAAQPPDRIASPPAARQSAAPAVLPPTPPTPPHCDPHSTYSSHSKL